MRAILRSLLESLFSPENIQAHQSMNAIIPGPTQ